MATVSGVEEMYNIIKAHGGSTTKELQEYWAKRGRKGKAAPSIYPLLNRGWVKRGPEKNGATTYITTSVAPLFAPARKRKYTRRNHIVLATPTEIVPAVLTPEQEKDQLVNELAQFHRAGELLKNSAALLQCAEFINLAGAEKALAMLAGLSRLR